MAECDGLCVTAYDVGLPFDGVVYPNPGCPAHAPEQVCNCGQPDRCPSPMHGRLTQEEAREIAHRKLGR